MTADPKPLAVRIPAAAKALGVSADKVRKAVARGEIRSVRFGGCILIPVVEMERLLGIEPEAAPTAAELLELAATLAGGRS